MDPLTKALKKYAKQANWWPVDIVTDHTGKKLTRWAMGPEPWVEAQKALDSVKKKKAK